MDIQFNFKNFEPSEHLKGYARRRFEKLSKYLKTDAGASELLVNLSVEKHRQLAEVVFNGEGLHLSAAEESPDMYATVDMVLDKLESQIKKQREKSKNRRKQAQDKSVQMQFISYTDMDGGGREKTIVEADRYEPKPMDVDEAAMQLENLKYEFLVFRNSETERINVIYLRKNGDFGLIDPGV